MNNVNDYQDYSTIVMTQSKQIEPRKTTELNQLSLIAAGLTKIHKKQGIGVLDHSGSLVIVVVGYLLTSNCRSKYFLSFIRSRHVYAPNATKT